MKWFKNILLFSTIFLVLFFFGCESSSPAKGEFETELVHSLFQNPPAEYRSFPFYSLNDKLEKDELVRQVELMKEAGFGGFYLHSRVGLLTEYLGQEWWETMDAAVDAALELGLQAYFYDEDRWPSGYAGGIVPSMGESYRAQLLARLPKETELPDGSKLLKEDGDYVYISYTAQMGNPTFNGTSYVDLMNPNVVSAFIDVTHKEYVKRYANKLPYSFAIFSDEPHIHARYFDSSTRHSGVKSYSPYVRVLFQEMFGYDFLDKVELLFEEKDNWREVRLQYQQAVAKQFETSFSKQIGDFCESHGVRFTGHYLGEDSYEKVAERIGNSFLHYRNMQLPGIDLLGMSVENRLVTARNLTSVANQYAIPRRLSELYGISGHNMSFEDRKRIANWHIITGINHLVPHLTLYSMKGIRKRDYPPTFSYHQPYWKYNKELEDYLGRISYAASIGEYLSQILVLSPLESEYLIASGEQDFTLGILRFIEDLQRFNYDYDIGDETIINDIATVSGNELKVGSMSYPMVVIPDMISIRKSTIDVLLKFAQSGGIIAHFGNRFPEFVDGTTNPHLISELQKVCVMLEEENLEDRLNELLEPNILVAGDPEGYIWSHTRQSGDGFLIHLANTSHLDSVRFSVSSQHFDGSPVLWNPENALCYSVQPNKNGMYEIELAPNSMVWFTSGTLSNNAKIAGAYQLPVNYTSHFSLNGQWKGKRLDENAITLDFASYSINDGETWSDPEPVIGIHERLERAGYNGFLRLKYLAEFNFVPTDVKLVVEQPDMYEDVRFNGTLVAFDGHDYYIDRQFLRTSVTSMVNLGDNTIELTLNYSAPVGDSDDPYKKYGTEIESVYLTGDFAVQGVGYSSDMNTQRNRTGLFVERPVHIYQSFIITEETDRFAGDLTIEGYPFYAGSFQLSQTFNLSNLDSDRRYAVKLANNEAIVTVVELNGHQFAPLYSNPFEIDVTEYINEGQNQIKLTLVNSLRNLMGPHHHSWREMVRVGPSSFSGAGGFPSPRGISDWYDARLESGNAAYWRDDYHFIPFGLLEPVQICIDEQLQ